VNPKAADDEFHFHECHWLLCPRRASRSIATWLKHSQPGIVMFRSRFQQQRACTQGASDPGLEPGRAHLKANGPT